MSRLLHLKWIFLVVILASILRLWRLGEVPAGPDWDEVSLGYNAYSVLRTGRDEYGTFLPLSLRSYNDYKPPLYMYASVPIIWLLGLNIWSVRLPSALFGVSTVISTYILVRELFRFQVRERRISRYGERIALLSSLLLAISPWHIQFSRIAFEANIGLAIGVWGIALFLAGLTNKKYLLLSFISFAVDLYAYHSARIFIPIMVMFLLFLFRVELKRNIRIVMFGFLLSFFLLLPYIRVVTDATTLNRLRGTSSLADQTGLLARSVEKLTDDKNRGDLLGQVFNNRRVVYAKTVLSGYMSHYSLKWLFLTGDNPRHHAPDTGLLYIWELPFFFLGLYVLLERGGRASGLLFGWLLIAPIAASPTTELPHAVRTLVFLPSFQIVIAFGIERTVIYLKKKYRILRWIFFLTILLIIFANIIYYINMYFYQMNREVSQYWQYGYKEAVDYAVVNGGKYSKVVVSPKLEQPHMFFLFYLKYDPILYLSQGGTYREEINGIRNAFDMYEFRFIDWTKEQRDGKTLFIVKPEEAPGEPKYVIRYLDGTPAIVIVD